MMELRVGEVVAVQGLKIILRIDEQSNRETLFYGGDKYKGISIREYVAVQRGFRDIVCIVEGEYLDESRVESSTSKPTYVRKVEVRPIGYFEAGAFREGIKFMPMIKDPAYLMREDMIAQMYGGAVDDGFVIGRMLKEDLPVALPWRSLFNTHIGIFGNTGSGKSNTLTKLYTVLFERKANSLRPKSKFVILDFNGEYTGAQLLSATNKSVLKLSTSGNGGDRFRLRSEEFWNIDTLSILFQATQITQRPFLVRVVEGRAKFQTVQDALTNYAKTTFQKIFSAAAPKPELLDLARSIARILQAEELRQLLNGVSWNSVHSKFFVPPGQYFNADGGQYGSLLADVVSELEAGGLDGFEQLILRVNLQLARDLLSGHVQFEHIQPLLKRVEASLANLRRVVQISSEQSASKLLTVISLRRCNSEMKKVLPLLIAKHYYEEHKLTVDSPPNKTLHLIVDEAHNILSETSTREQLSWKDYRLELFEEIIKEGRKFGVFLTLSSQRPADISPTIVSQVHNFFIHRLVNDRDLFLLENTITTLDRLSRGLIPTLAKGCCVVTGVSFDIPMVLQVDMLEKAKQPDSEDVNLGKLWA
jgi:uncharacterized protein